MTEIIFDTKFSPITADRIFAYKCSHGEKRLDSGGIAMCNSCVNAIKNLNSNAGPTTKNVITQRLFKSLKKEYETLGNIYKMFIDIYHPTIPTITVTIHNANGAHEYYPVGMNLNLQSMMFIGPHVKLTTQGMSDFSVANRIEVCATSMRIAVSNNAQENLDNILYYFNQLPIWHPIFFGFIITGSNSGHIKEYVKILKRKFDVTVEEIEYMIENTEFHAYGAKKQHWEIIRREFQALEGNPMADKFANKQLDSMHTNNIRHNPNNSFPALQGGYEDPNKTLENMIQIGSYEDNDEDGNENDDDQNLFEDIDEEEDLFGDDDDEDLFGDDEDPFGDDEDLFGDDDPIEEKVKQEDVQEILTNHLEEITIIENGNGELVIAEEEDERA